MSYSDLTTNDRNPVKRWLQRRRLDDALWLVQRDMPAGWSGNVLDFGGGDGGLCGRVLQRYPEATVTCYEPAGDIRAEAETALAGTAVTVSGTLNRTARYDLLACCEVFEHLPAAQTAEALDALREVVSSSGRVVLGVPNEIFAVGFTKGLFRMTRRYGAYDARWSTVLAAAVGRPRKDRPQAQLDGLPFLFDHTGFDYRELVRLLPQHGLRVERLYGSPFHRLPRAVNSEIYLVCQPAG